MPPIITAHAACRGHAPENTLAGVAYSRGEQTDCPVLDEALAWVECRVHEVVPMGDHTLVIGEVLDGAILREGEPLTQRHLGWSYGG